MSSLTFCASHVLVGRNISILPLASHEGGMKGAFFIKAANCCSTKGMVKVAFKKRALKH
jgi:hypothetical protein